MTTRALLAAGIRALGENTEFIAEAMAKRSTGRRHQKVVKIDPQTHEAMGKLADSLGVSRSGLAEAAVHWMLEREEVRNEIPSGGNYLLERTSDRELIAELERRGYDVRKSAD